MVVSEAKLKAARALQKVGVQAAESGRVHLWMACLEALRVLMTDTEKETSNGND